MRSPLIVGAGPAGAAAAIVLARAGLRPLLIERSAGAHHTVCGDFLSGEAAAAVAALGVDPLALGAAPVRWLRLLHGGAQAECVLPFPAFGVSRRALDEALRAHAADCGAELRRGAAARGLRCEADGFAIRVGGAVLTAPAVFLATGKHDLRGAARPRGAARMVGIKRYFRLSAAQRAALGDAVELVLLPGGYAGLQPVEDGLAVLCALLPAEASGPGALDRLIATERHLGQRLGGAMAVGPVLTVAGMPYGYLAAPGGPAGLFRLGDQAAVIPSLTGAGMAIALRSGQAAARAYLAGGGAAAYHRSLGRVLRRPMRVGGMLHGALLAPRLRVLAMALCGAWPGAMRAAAAATRVRMPEECRIGVVTPVM